MDAYDLHEGRLIQSNVVTSAANATSVQIPAVPAGKIHTILQLTYYPSAAETKTAYFGLAGAGCPDTFALSQPQQIALSNSLRLPLVREGMELKLWPGQYALALRDSATAGSTMTLLVMFIESDLPYYAYEEPQKRVIAQKFRRSSQIIRSGGGSGTSFSPPSGPPGREGRGGPGGGGGELI